VSARLPDLGERGIGGAHTQLRMTADLFAGLPLSLRPGLAEFTASDRPRGMPNVLTYRKGATLSAADATIHPKSGNV